MDFIEYLKYFHVVKTGRLVYMAYKSKRKNWPNLTLAIAEDLINFGGANEDLRKGIKNFNHLLETESIALANQNSSGRIWESKSLIKCLFEILDPILEKLIPPRSYIGDLLRLNKIYLPFSDTVKTKESFREFAEKIKTAKESLEALIPTSDSQNWASKSDGTTSSLTGP